MTVFLTSSPSGSLDDSHKVDGLDEMNCFVDNLREHWKSGSRCLIIAASPDGYEGNDRMSEDFYEMICDVGLSISGPDQDGDRQENNKLDIWDSRTEDLSKEKLHSYDVIILGGGHVPTQNAFFKKIGLREKIQDFDGIVIGISAGTMNSADIVYAQPELEGEAADPDYKRFLYGIGLTKTMILPHYQMVKDMELDGRRLYEEITYEDSFGKRFLVLPDGSYLMIKDGVETVWGRAYCISDGVFRQICEDGQTLCWK